MSATTLGQGLLGTRVPRQLYAGKGWLAGRLQLRVPEGMVLSHQVAFLALWGGRERA